MYTPDNWVIVRIAQPDEIIYKVLAGWNGSYLYGSSWRLNSGITRVQEDGDQILFHGHSGSVYCCARYAEGLQANCAHVLAQLRHQFPDKVGYIGYQDFLKEFIPHY